MVRCLPQFSGVRKQGDNYIMFDELDVKWNGKHGGTNDPEKVGQYIQNRHVLYGNN